MLWVSDKLGGGSCKALDGTKLQLTFRFIQPLIIDQSVSERVLLVLNVDSGCRKTITTLNTKVFYLDSGVYPDHMSFGLVPVQVY